MSFAIAALFCVHPLHSEVVANVKGRDDILALLNGLLSLYLIFRYQASQKTKYFVTSVVFFFLALLSKGHMLTFAAVVPLSLYYFTATPPRKLVQWTIPYLGAAMLFLMIQYNIIGKVTRLQTDFIDNPILAASSWQDGLATRIDVLGLFLRKLMIPYPLSCDYSFAAIAPTTWANPLVYVVALLYGALIYLGIRGFRAKKVWSYAVWLYLITILPVSNLLIDYVVAFAERSMFTPSLGWIMLWVVGMGLGLEALERKGIMRSETIKSVSKVGMTVLLIVFGFITVSRNTVWKDDLTLFSTDLNTHPESVRLNLLYAQELINKHPEQMSGPLTPDLQKAKAALDAVQKISPDVPKCLLLQGHIAKLTGDHALAETYYQKTLALDEKNPSVYFNLGVMADIRQDYNTAKSMYIKSLELFPNYPAALANVGIIYGREGNYDAAIEHLEKSIKLDPTSVNDYNNLAMAYQFKGDKIKAEYYRQKALEIGKSNN